MIRISEEEMQDWSQMTFRFTEAKNLQTFPLTAINIYTTSELSVLFVTQQKCLM